MNRNKRRVVKQASPGNQRQSLYLIKISYPPIGISPERDQSLSTKRTLVSVMIALDGCSLGKCCHLSHVIISPFENRRELNKNLDGSSKENLMNTIKRKEETASEEELKNYTKCEKNNLLRLQSAVHDNNDPGRRNWRR